MTLLDKPDVGGAILEDIMIDVLRAMYHSSNSTNNSTQRRLGPQGKVRDLLKIHNQ